MESRDQIYKLLKKEIELLSNKEIPSGDTEIFKSGILDSLNVLHIITLLEHEFVLQIDPFDLTLDTLGSLNKITEFVCEKQK
jgi:acyl carrier protein